MPEMPRPDQRYARPRQPVNAKPRKTRGYRGFSAADEPSSHRPRTDRKTHERAGCPRGTGPGDVCGHSAAADGPPQPPRDVPADL